MNKKANKKSDIVKPKFQRLFVNENKIFKALYCSICMEVLRDPAALKCTHSFCSECIANWIGANIKANSMPKCPLC